MTDFQPSEMDRKIAAGLYDASMQAALLAKRTNTKLVIWQDDKVVEISPDAWLAEHAIAEKP